MPIESGMSVLKIIELPFHGYEMRQDTANIENFAIHCLTVFLGLLYEGVTRMTLRYF